MPNLSHPPPLAPDPLDISFSEDMLSKLYAYFVEYGDAFRVFSPITQREIYVFNDPECVKHVLVGNAQNYTKGLGIERVGILLGQGIMVSEGELWRRQRKMIQPAFHRAVLEQMIERICAANRGLLQKWTAAANDKHQINLTQDMSEVTLKIVLAAIFGDDLEAMTQDNGANPFALLTEDAERNLRFAYKFRALSKVILGCVARRTQREHAGNDLLALLIGARDRKSGETMSDRQLVDEVMTLIVAGHETTASALNWIWYLLSQNSIVEKRLHQEIDSCAQPPSRVDAVERFPYTRQIIAETLRLYPPGWLLTRRSINADRIAGHSIPPGTDVFISPYILHRHPVFWESPEEFNPERFAPEGEAERHRFAYLPFALGPRACIGEHFAMLEMILHVTILASSIRLRFLATNPVELECQINLRPKHDLYMLPERRE